MMLERLRHVLSSHALPDKLIDIQPKEQTMESTLAAMLAGVTLGLVIGVFTQTMKLQKRLRQLSIVDAKLDALLKQAGIEFDPFEHVQQEVIDALKSGSKIEAIRLYKESSNVSLKEAKENVEEVQRRTGLGG